MAGKSKQEKRKRAKAKKREKELLTQNSKKKVEKLLAVQEDAELGNNAEPLPPNVNEDANKDAEIPVETMEENVKRLEATKVAQKLVEEPFDPQKLIADMLKKKDGA